MSEQTNSTKQTASIVNSFLLFAALGMLGFIGNGTWENSKKLEMIAASQISRTEFEAKLAEIRQEQRRLDARVAELWIEITKR